MRKNKNRNYIYSAAAITMASCLCLSGMAFAGTAADAAQDPDQTSTSKTLASESTSDALLLGTETENAAAVTLPNKTGMDITFFSMTAFDESYDANAQIRTMQSALIEQGYLDDVADGSYGPKTQAAVKAFREANQLSADGGIDNEMLTLLYGTYDDGNQLEDGAEWKPDEQAVLYILQPDEQAEETEAIEAADDYLSLLTILEGAGIESDYIVTFKSQDDQEYTLHVFPSNSMEMASIYVDGDIAYLEYTYSGLDEMISTRDAEQAVYDAEHPAYSYSDYDYGYSDYGYDYSYDYGYAYSYEPETPQGSDGCITDGLFY